VDTGVSSPPTSGTTEGKLETVVASSLGATSATPVSKQALPVVAPLAQDVPVTTSASPLRTASSLPPASSVVNAPSATPASQAAAQPASNALSVLPLTEMKSGLASQLTAPLARTEAPSTASTGDVGGQLVQGTGERSASGAASDLEGPRDDTFTTPLSLPEPELPSDGDRLSSSDIVKGLLLGVRPRANLLPRGGSLRAGVAALLAHEDGPGSLTQERSPLRALFINPLLASLLPPGANGAGRVGALDEDDPGEEAGMGAGDVLLGVALTAAAGAGVLVSARLRRGRSCSPRLGEV
jgi:hypothetical protein